MSKPAVSKTVKSLLSNAIVGRGELAIKRLIADLESPRWPSVPSDWSYYVPEEIRKAWSELSLEAKAAARATAAYLRDV